MPPRADRLAATPRPAGDSEQRPLRRRLYCSQQLMPGVTPHKLECPAREEAVHETHAHHHHALRRS